MNYNQLFTVLKQVFARVNYVAMLQIVKYHAHGLTRSCVTDIFRISGGTIRPGDTAYFHDIVHIPPLPPSRLDGCSLISIDYFITVCCLITVATVAGKIAIIIVDESFSILHFYYFFCITIRLVFSRQVALQP